MNKFRCMIMFIFQLYGISDSFSESVAGYQIEKKYRPFPDGFKFGISTSAHQIEGAWNVSDKGENIWDRLSHTTKYVWNNDTGDVACDSYHQYPRDVEMLKEIGVDFYRFSLSWSRILPTGYANEISEDGISYYNNLIDLLIANNITPAITLYHWDLPQPLQDIGGWPNPLLEEYFVDYARVAFEAFGDRVKMWATFNEPHMFCYYGYGMSELAPALNFHGIGEYMCGHTVLKAHARVYHLYDDEYRAEQKGRISISLNGAWYEPENSSKSSDLHASETALQFEVGWFANPIFSKEGDYPNIMITNIQAKSTEQGYATSRLPCFTKEEIEYIRGTSDFFGLNHYTTSIVRLLNITTDKYPEHSYIEDTGTFSYQKDDWPTSEATSWFAVVPWGFKKLLTWIKQRYDNPDIFIFENGFSDLGGLSDSGRVSYFHKYINALLDAIEEGCSVSGYAAWSLMDNFEWMAGYREKFGLYSVDFSSPNKTRTIKDSGRYFSEIIRTRSVEKDLDADNYT